MWCEYEGHGLPNVFLSTCGWATVDARAGNSPQKNGNDLTSRLGTKPRRTWPRAKLDGMWTCSLGWSSQWTWSIGHQN